MFSCKELSIILMWNQAFKTIIAIAIAMGSVTFVLKDKQTIKPKPKKKQFSTSNQLTDRG